MQPTHLLISDHVIHYWRLRQLCLTQPKNISMSRTNKFYLRFFVLPKKCAKNKMHNPIHLQQYFHAIEFFFFGGGVEEAVAACTFPTLYLTVLNRITISKRGKPKCSEKNQCCFVNHNFLRFNMDLWDEKPATNHLSYDTALCYSLNMTI